MSKLSDKVKARLLRKMISALRGEKVPDTSNPHADFLFALVASLVSDHLPLEDVQRLVARTQQLCEEMQEASIEAPRVDEGSDIFAPKQTNAGPSRDHEHNAFLTDPPTIQATVSGDVSRLEDKRGYYYPSNPLAKGHQRNKKKEEGGRKYGGYGYSRRDRKYE